MKWNRLLAPAGLLLAGLFPVFAQKPVFRMEVKLVRLLATVKDASGRPVSDLRREDFTVYDNGVKQKITLFEHHTSQPLSVVLLVDASASTASKLKEETTSVLRFVKALIREGNPLDAVSLYSFNQDVTLETGFTRRLAPVERKLKKLTAEAGTSLYDAIYFAAHALKSREGRKVMVVVTDGADTTSVKSFQNAVEAAQMADAVIYGIMIIPVTSNAGRQIGGENALITLSTGTGGRVFAATLGETLDTSFRQILRDLRTQYLLGYYPRHLPYTTERYHKVEVEVDRPNLRVVTRTGYYGGQKGVVPEGKQRKGPFPIP